MTEERRIGVYICHCGGNISDYVDVAAVRDALKDEPGVLTLPEFKTLVDDAVGGALSYNGKPVRTVAYVYCVGSRQPGGNEYCSKFCCAATVHASLQVANLDPSIHQYHLNRDIRTYGKYERCTRSRGSGARCT